MHGIVDGSKLALDTAFVWAESSMLIGSADMIIENIREQRNTGTSMTKEYRLSSRSMLYRKINSDVTSA